MTIARICRPGVLVVTIPAAFAASDQAAQVTVDKSSFRPKQLTVQPSDIVNWVNRDNITDTGN
jgi:plastocyanin